ncbi:DUF1573 domain-containing protein [Tautonia sociabilis]|uniref:DUF1573 domain-containing protein n=1 Tax=Tautonia sociabilis TaxID=2080755 RepID=UPI0013155093
MVEHTFVVKNTTGAPVKVRRLRTTCTCTTATLSDYELAPGEHTELRLVADVPRVNRDNLIGCTVETDSAAHPLWESVLRFRSYGRIGVERTTLNLGTIEARATPGDGAEGVAWAEAFAPGDEAPPRLRLAPLNGPVRARLEGPIEQNRIEAGAVQRVRDRRHVTQEPDDRSVHL